MQIVVAGDNPVLSRTIRDLLEQRGENCPSDHVASLDTAARLVADARPQVVVFELTADAERALKAIEDVHRRDARTQILAIGPASDPKLILRTMRAGAAHYIDEAELDAELVAALEKCGDGCDESADAGRLIAFLAPSGGSGSSTLAVNVATALAQSHGRCALLDLKLGAGDLSTLLDLQPAHTLADFCANLGRMDRNMFQNCFARHPSGVHLLAAPESFADIERVRADAVRRALDMSRASFPYVVADLDHTYDPRSAVLLEQADFILVVLRLDFQSLKQARRTFEYFEHLGVPTKRVKLVVNRYHRPRELRVSQLEQALGAKVQHYIPDDPKTVNRANNKGVPVVVDHPRARVSKRILEMAHSVNGAHK